MYLLSLGSLSANRQGPAAGFAQEVSSQILSFLSIREHFTLLPLLSFEHGRLLYRSAAWPPTLDLTECTSRSNDIACRSCSVSAFERIIYRDLQLLPQLVNRRTRVLARALVGMPLKELALDYNSYPNDDVPPNVELKAFYQLMLSLNFCRADKGFLRGLSVEYLQPMFSEETLTSALPRLPKLKKITLDAGSDPFSPAFISALRAADLEELHLRVVSPHELRDEEAVQLYQTGLPVTFTPWAQSVFKDGIISWVPRL
eukprot:g43221.t1